MSCGAALAVALMMSNPAVAEAAAQPPVAANTPLSVAAEPLFADIVTRSGALKAIVDAWTESRAADQAGFFAGADYLAFRDRAHALAESDMQGHLILKERGTDNDLKCILRGISEDLPKKIAAVEAAPNASQRAVALSELSYLLNDNVEVITSPPRPEV
jgi:hypothetical protein